MRSDKNRKPDCMICIKDNRDVSNSSFARGNFETDVLKRCHADHRFYGMAFDEYFIDIGLPEDYQKDRDDLRSNSYRMTNESKANDN